MNAVFFGLIVVAFVVAGYQQVDSPGNPTAMAALTKAIIDDASAAVTLALGLIGIMSCFLGVMRVAERGGLLIVVARLLRAPLRRLFPDVPPDHPAMGAMIFNIAANALGLGNAATPFGIRAMAALERINPIKGTASDAMVMFLVINTASVTLLPTTVIALRAASGSQNPAAIIPTTLAATVSATAFAIIAARIGNRLWPTGSVAAGSIESASSQAQLSGSGASGSNSSTTCRDILDDDPAALTAVGTVVAEAEPQGYPAWVGFVAIAVFVLLAVLIVGFGREISPWLLPGLIVMLLSFGAARGVPVYEAFVDGASDGFRIAIRIIPYLVAILLAIGMVRASGALQAATAAVADFTGGWGVPPEAIIMTALRTLSGSGAYAYLASVLNDTAVGPDSYTGLLVSTIQGSTETTFYVLAVYCGSVGVQRMRHALIVGLLADIVGLIAAAAACQWLVPS